MHARICLLVALVTACGKGDRSDVAGSGSADLDTRAQCVKVRGHLVDLIAEAYVSAPETTFDGLDRSDPHIAEGLDLALTRDTFGAFLASAPGKAWIDRQKARSLASPEMASTVDNCARLATQANLDCWLGARNVSAFHLCPPPGPATAAAP